MHLLAARARAAVPPDDVELGETILLVAATSIAAALIHAVVVPEHVGEGVAHVAFFVVVAALQLAWAVAVFRRGDDRRVLLAGMAGSLAVAAVWALSRTAGVPAGPEAWRPEAIGPLDLLATYDELLVAAGAWALLRGADAWRLQLVRGMAMVLVVASLVALFSGHGHHGH